MSTPPSSARVAFVMDPMETVNIHADTSFALMREIQARGYSLVHVDPGHIALEQGKVFLRGQALSVQEDERQCYVPHGEVHLPATDLEAIFIRTDPPFDQDYLNATWLLSFAVEHGVKVFNDPKGIRNANEKLYALEWPQLCPETSVTSSIEDVKNFMTRVGGTAVAKPLDGHGGRGVVLLREGDSNIKAMVELLSNDGKHPIIVQEYLPEASQGDRRLFMLDGELVAVLQRTPADDDHRGNVHVGGKTSGTEINERDREIAAAMGPRLREDGLFFVGLDVIAGKLIEVNVTSPTLIQELARHGGPDVAKLIVDAALGETVRMASSV